MALRDKLIEGPLRPPPRTCAVCWLLTWVPGDDAEVLGIMLADGARYPSTAIADILRPEFNVIVGSDAVGRHRRLHMGTDL